MNAFFRIALCAVVIPMIPACKRRADTAKADLGEAGYKLTAEDWFRASRENNVEVMKKFVAGGFASDTRDGQGDTALHVAAASGARDAADLLLDRGMPVDLSGSSQRTPLMFAVISNQTEMVRWLLRQGADPRLKDENGFRPLMLAVREGSAGSVAELAAYDREDLDPALLLAALVGRVDVIDALTNYGASVYTRMDDGRTPLMVASENGHVEAVKLLLDIGSSRYAVDQEGRTAADIATAAGHPEIASLIARDPLPGEIALESPAEIAESMDAFVDQALAKSVPAAGYNKNAVVPEIRPTGRSPATSVAIDGMTLSMAALQLSSSTSGEAVSAIPTGEEPFAMPPLAMRHYRERQTPVSVESVQAGAVILKIAGTTPRKVTVREGESIPGSNLVIVRVKRRMEDSKLNPGGTAEISVVELRDSSTGATREWISGVPAHAHDPVALVEDTATGKRYIASPGQHFKDGDGGEYLISDVRPNQMVIKELATGQVRTIPLRGPRG